MRTINSFKNITISILSQIVIAALGFISRKVFINSLGAEYLGVNGLLTNVLSMLALVESGIGTSIVFYMYRALAEKDEPKIIALVQLYKKTYMVLAFIIALLSVGLYPFLDTIIKGESISYIGIVYFIFVANNIVGYLNAHKISLIYADQKGYVLVKIGFLFSLLSMISKIVILMNTKNYILFLSFDLFTFICQALYSGKIINKRYPYIKTKEKYMIGNVEKTGIIKNVKALFLHNLGSYVVFGTDNILISSFIGVVVVGIYSNYTMILGQLRALIDPVLSGMSASIGNLIATENTERKYSIFKVTYLINFWIYSVAVVFLYNVLEPFLNWWLGKGYLLNKGTFLFILLNFYITGLRGAISSFKDKSGIFINDRYVPLIESAINLLMSIFLAKQLGLAGIFLGTTISTLTTVFWVVPFLTYKYVFKAPLFPYFSKYIFYTLLTLTSCGITKLTCDTLIKSDSFFSLIERGIISIGFPMIFYLIIFFKNSEFQYLYNLSKNTILKLRHKFKTRKLARHSGM